MRGPWTVMGGRGGPSKLARRPRPTLHRRRHPGLDRQPRTSANQRGHTLVELVVALPILAIGGAAVAGLLLSAGVHLLEAERRLATATVAPALLDSLAATDSEEPVTGRRDVMGRPLHWEWDGEGSLFLHLVQAGPSDNGFGEVGPPGTIQWTVSVHGGIDPSQGDGDGEGAQ